LAAAQARAADYRTGACGLVGARAFDADGLYVKLRVMVALSICMLALPVIESPTELVQVLLMTMPKLMIRPGIT